MHKNKKTAALSVKAQNCARWKRISAKSAAMHVSYQNSNRSNPFFLWNFRVLWRENSRANVRGWWFEFAKILAWVRERYFECWVHEDTEWGKTWVGNPGQRIKGPEIERVGMWEACRKVQDPVCFLDENELTCDVTEVENNESWEDSQGRALKILAVRHSSVVAAIVYGSYVGKRRQREAWVTTHYSHRRIRASNERLKCVWANVPNAWVREANFARGAWRDPLISSKKRVGIYRERKGTTRFAGIDACHLVRALARPRIVSSGASRWVVLDRVRG